MVRNRIVLLVTLTVVSLGIASPAFAQSDARIGAGIGITHLDHLFSSTAYVPKFIFATDMLTVGGGFSFHAGEDVTNFGLEFDFGINALKMPGGALAFGAQFDMLTDVPVAVNKKETLIVFGGFVEARIAATDQLTFGLRTYPFQYLDIGDATRFGMLDVGLHVTYFF